MSYNNNLSPKIMAVYLKQDDPKKNTIIKLKKYRLIKIYNSLKYTHKKAIILDPFSDKTLTPKDHDVIKRYGLIVIDCSWNMINSVFKNKYKTGRKLPPLLAANSVNYGRWNKLSSVEALSGALIITGFPERAEALLSKFKWGHIFLEINKHNFKNYLDV